MKKLTQILIAAGITASVAVPTQSHASALLAAGAGLLAAGGVVGAAAGLITGLLLGKNLAPGGCENGGSGPGCSANTDVNVNVNIDPEAHGKFVQLNSGNIHGQTKIHNLLMRNDGDVKVETMAVANNISVELDLGDVSNVNYLYQNNSGDVTASTEIQQSIFSKTGNVELTTTAVANTISIAGLSDKMSNLGIAQCNTGDVTASTKFYHDPLSLTVNTSAIGNNISIGKKTSE